MKGEPAALALASAASGAEVLAVDLDGAMAVLFVRHPEALADPEARSRVLAAARAQGIRNVAIELTDDDGAASRLPRD